MRIANAFLWVSSLVALGSVLASSPVVHGQPSPSANSLTHTITALDTALFDAYNRCDLPALGSFVTNDLEFYHDHDGRSGRDEFLESTRKNICGKVQRELVAGSLEVYPLGQDGALAIGVHRFHHPGKDDTEPVGEGRFVMIWRHQDGGWKLARAISYAHRALEK